MNGGRVVLGLAQASIVGSPQQRTQEVLSTECFMRMHQILACGNWSAERPVYSQRVELLELDAKYIQSGTEHDLISSQKIE